MRFRIFPLLSLAIMFALSPGGPARAMDGCSGWYSATLPSPLTVPTIVGLDLSDNADATTRLAQAFSGGMQDAGVTVAGTPTVLLRLSYQIVGQGGTTPGGGATTQAGDPQSGWSSWSGGETAALQGGITLAMPDIPNYDAFVPNQPTQSGLLMLRAEARNGGAGAPAWVAILQCKVQTTDSLALARQLGYLLGGAVGKERSKAPV
jgi:hypothetical protein